MKFSEVVAQTLVWLQREGRVSYRALKREFALDDEVLDDLKAELIEVKELAVDKDGKMLVWTGASPVSSFTFQVSSSQPSVPGTQHPDPNSQTLDARRQTLDSARPEAERRQLTVLFCDLVDSTTLSALLDPEEYREVVRSYQESCAEVIRHYAGHTAQHLGDGILVYFGYPAAHEDDAQRALRTGLEILAGLRSLNARLQPAIKARLPHPIQVRIGIHTGLVVIGEIGSSEKREILALGETPNLAARLQGIAQPDTLVVSAATQQLVVGLFACQELGPQALKGITTPIVVYQVLGESGAQSRFEVAIRTGLTPLVGREAELRLLRQRWDQAKADEGQVVLLSGEPGIGKSRLVQELKEQLAREGTTRLEFRCSPYHQNSAFYPVIEHLQRRLQFSREDTPEERTVKLEQALMRSRLDLQEAVPLLASLLSLPALRYTLPALSPQRQKQKTQEALVAWVLEEAERQPVYCPWEDVHWADPSTLELLNLLIDQAPTARLYLLLAFRPEFTPPWGKRSHISQLTLSRLGRSQVTQMIEKVAGGKALPAEVIQQIVVKTDGVPLFVEELTKTVVEQHVGETGWSPLPLAIPATLQDSLMARLDRLNTAKEIAQLGATLGREFSYELLQTVSPLDEATLQKGLSQLVEAELVYQRGVPPQARYTFKHALIQDAAYQSLLKSKRQQLHQQIAQVLEERFPETKETQPELLAHHYTEAGLIEQAIPYWQKAGQRATERSAYAEATGHFTKGLELLKTLPDTSERAQQELTLQIALGVPLMATKGYAAPEVEKAYSRARELCQQVGEASQLFPALYGLWTFHNVRTELQTARELGEQLLSLAQAAQDPTLLLEAHRALGSNLLMGGEFVPALEHLEQGITLYDPQQHNPHASHTSVDLGVACRSRAALALWVLGYPDQARKRIHEALTRARELSHPFTLAFVLTWAAWLHQFRREERLIRELAEAVIELCSEQGFPFLLAQGMMYWGQVLVVQGQGEEGIAHIRQGLATLRAPGVEPDPEWLARLATAYAAVEQIKEGLTVLAEALTVAGKTGERFYEAELYRLKGQLTLQSKTSLWQVSDKSQASQGMSEVPSTQHPTPSTQAEAETEACFHKAIEVARKQQAKSWELRAVMSLARLWQQQGKTAEAHQMLAEIYGWFTEGFDTKDLQEARALLEELSH